MPATVFQAPQAFAWGVLNSLERLRTGVGYVWLRARREINRPSKEQVRGRKVEAQEGKEEAEEEEEEE